jgi:DNA-binding HxlR family transcriptional regulator
MSKKTDNSSKKYICVLDFAFQRIGGKYKGRILWALHKHQIPPKVEYTLTETGKELVPFLKYLVE